MQEFRISKYNPSFRGSRGKYLNQDEWTSICDVGKKINIDAFLKVESNYIEVIDSILEKSGCSEFSISELEDYRQNITGNNYAGDVFELKNLPAKTGMSFDKENVLLLIRMALRELAWFKIQILGGGFIHSGYEMYIYIGLENPVDLNSLSKNEDIFIENFKSPYSNTD